MKTFIRPDRFPKDTWKPGPWQTEPDKAVWVDPETGYDCMIHRGPSGALCGYVGITPKHPFYKQDYDSVDVSVHGGLTFGRMSAESEDESFGICHVPEKGREEHVFWLGFDCAHSQDYRPKYNSELDMISSNIFGEPCSYKDFGYVKSEVESLAKQLKEMEI